MTTDLARPAPEGEPYAETPADAPQVAGRRIFLIRHADALEGPRDHELGRHLTELGRHQAEALARRLANWKVDAIICSDKHRSYETALAVHRHHPDVPLLVDAVFREVSRRNVEAHARGDSEQIDLPARLQEAWDRVTTQTHDITVVIVHSGLIKYFLGRIIKCEGMMKPRFHSTETGITGFQMRPKGPMLEFFNDTHHLTPELVSPGPKAPWLEPHRG
jgi:broad specificity phosphatase PhoE